jgi:hypothetical protein
MLEFFDRVLRLLIEIAARGCKDNIDHARIAVAEHEITRAIGIAANETDHIILVVILVGLDCPSSNDLEQAV